MVEKRILEHTIDLLIENNIDTFFLVTGGAIVPTIDYIGQHPKAKYYCFQHEQAAAMAAEGYYRTTDKVGAVLTTSGPGAQNLLNGVCGCWYESIPCIFITGQVSTYESSDSINANPRQLGFQETPIVDSFKGFTKFAAKVTKKENTETIVKSAIKACKEGRFGPCLIDFPVDIQTATSTFTIEKITHDKVVDIDLDDKISVLKDMLNNSKRPLILLGHGVRLSNSSEKAKELIERLNIPFVVSWGGFDLIDHSHERFIGDLGVYGRRGANFAVQNCDLLISIGSRLDTRQTGGNLKTFARDAKKVMVDIDPNELNKTDLKIDLKIKSDAKFFLKKLFDKLKKYNFSNEWLDYCQSIRKKYPILLKKMIDEKTYVNSYYFVKTLSRYTKKYDSIITDMGFSFTTTHQALDVKDDQDFFTNSGHAPMGWGLPAAIGAYYSKKKSKANLICLTGEGGFQMNIQELATTMHHKIPIKIFIFNNGGYLTIKQTQILGFNGRIMGADNSSGLSFPNYKHIAKSHKMSYQKIKNHKDLGNNIRDILKSKNATICELIMNPNEEQIPKAINRRNDAGKSIPTDFEDMYPFLPREELSSNNLD